MVNASSSQYMLPSGDPRLARVHSSYNSAYANAPGTSSRSSTYLGPQTVNYSRDSHDDYHSWRSSRPTEPHFPRSPSLPSTDLAQQAASSRMDPQAMDPSRALEPQHRVHILHCRCGAFISDRGMRAVLLLRPSITLFSTDASPTNCGPLPIDESGEAGACGVERTCDCLTQSLACYECGNVVGYHIMHPCSRCVDSVSRQHRAGKANGHRWVFHYGEVTSRERRYVYGEPGIILPGRGRTRPSSPVDPSNYPTPRADHYTTEPDRPKVDVSMPEDNGAMLGEYAPRLAKPCQAVFGPTPMLRDGDTLFWHMLKASGERAPPVDPASRRISRPAR